MRAEYQRGPYDEFVRFRSSWRRVMRLIFPSPAEMALVRLLGGYVITFHIVRHWKNPYFPLSIVIWWPKIFRQEHVKREVRVGKFYVDFGNDVQAAIEVLGFDYHQNVLEEQARHDYLVARGWRILYLTGTEIKRRPKQVHEKVTKFLTR